MIWVLLALSLLIHEKHEYWQTKEAEQSERALLACSKTNTNLGEMPLRERLLLTWCECIRRALHKKSAERFLQGRKQAAAKAWLAFCTKLEGGIGWELFNGDSLTFFFFSFDDAAVNRIDEHMNGR